MKKKKKFCFFIFFHSIILFLSKFEEIARFMRLEEEFTETSMLFE